MQTRPDDPSPRLIAELTAWFQQRLSQSAVQFGDGPMSYDGNSRYDLQFHRLQRECAAHWARQHGFVPTPGQMMQAFFGAEFERFRAAHRADRSWWRRLLQRFGRSFRSVRSATGLDTDGRFQA